jgi:hypothetical protein
MEIMNNLKKIKFPLFNNKIIKLFLIKIKKMVYNKTKSPLIKIEIKQFNNIKLIHIKIEIRQINIFLNNSILEYKVI